MGTSPGSDRKQWEATASSTFGLGTTTGTSLGSYGKPCETTASVTFELGTTKFVNVDRWLGKPREAIGRHGSVTFGLGTTISTDRGSHGKPWEATASVAFGLGITIGTGSGIHG